MKKITYAILFLCAALTSCNSCKNNNTPPDAPALTDSTPVAQYPAFPFISDDSLLTLVQQQTLRYFYDFGHPTSGLARERSSSGDMVTTGGSGFGLMALLVGIERNFITREEGLQRFSLIVDFLLTADRFHGAYSHWLNGKTGKAQSFSPNDNGGDLVETAFLMQGLLTVKQYFKDDASELARTLCQNITTLWQEVEWDWYRKDNSDVLYWHWSPDKAWVMNFPVRGYNECLIMYVLAAASPTHGVPASVYHNGWAQGGQILAPHQAEGYDFNLRYQGTSTAGPLFWAHYSFLGLDPRGLSDAYTNYFTEMQHYTLANHDYCVRNPKGYPAYSDSCWGLTASDIKGGYTASSPTNDNGTIAPTAALSSFPYTPAQSMRALRTFYYAFGDKIWKQYGFRDAFNLSQSWVANDFLAIDQGPIVVMIENYRSGLLWRLFMQDEDVKNGLVELGFTVSE